MTGHCDGKPIFILAPARSFSTVTTALLGGHPEIYAFPELLLFTAPTVGEVLDQVQKGPNRNPVYIQARVSGIYRAIAAAREGDQSAAAISRARCWLQHCRDWPTRQLMDHLLRLVSPRVGLEKSPETVNSDGALASCLEAYPGARYLHLTRHPVTSQRSMQKHHQETLVKPLPPRALVATCASAWYLAHRRIRRALRQLPDEQWIQVRAEDLLRTPNIWLPQILSWLGLRHDEMIISRMLQTELWEFGGRGPTNDLFGGDPSFIRSPTLRPVTSPGPVTFDSSWALPDEMCRRMTALARDLGY